MIFWLACPYFVPKNDLLQQKKIAFCEKLVKCFDEKDYHKKYLCAKELYDYYMAQNSNFDINNYSFRSSI